MFVIPHFCSQVPDINTEILFGNIEEVTHVSQRFLDALQDACTKEQMVGEVFVTFAPEMRGVYAVYCRNHDNAAGLLEKVCGTTTAGVFRSIYKDI